MSLAIHSRTAFKFVAVLSMVAVMGPAYAQAWIGQVVGDMIAQQQAAAAEHACMSGTAMIASEIEEARPSSYASMREYWAAVKAGAPIDASKHFHPGKKSAWIKDDKKLVIAPGTKLVDPFALPDAQLAAEPLNFFRAGDGSSVRIQWEVHGQAGGLVGTYDAELRRSGSVWRPFELRIVPAKQYLEPLVQYCHRASDVMPYRLRTTEAAMNYTAKRSAKMAEKAVKAEAEAAKAQLAANADKGKVSDSKLQLARDAATKAEKARKKADDAKLAAKNAAAEHAKANADAKALEDLRDKARARLAVS